MISDESAISDLTREDVEDYEIEKRIVHGVNELKRFAYTKAFRYVRILKNELKNIKLI